MRGHGATVLPGALSMADSERSEPLSAIIRAVGCLAQASTVVGYPSSALVPRRKRQILVLDAVVERRFELDA